MVLLGAPRESSFRTAHDVALDLDSRPSAELAELGDAAVARIVDAALELEPASDRAELGRLRVVSTPRCACDRPEVVAQRNGRDDTA